MKKIIEILISDWLTSLDREESIEITKECNEFKVLFHVYTTVQQMKVIQLCGTVVINDMCLTCFRALALPLILSYISKYL